MSDKLDKTSVSALTSFLACLFYGFVSTSITFFNKAVLASYEFKSPNIMTLFQILFSLLFLVTMKGLGRIQYPAITWQTSVKVASDNPLPHSRGGWMAACTVADYCALWCALGGVAGHAGDESRPPRCPSPS